MSITNGTQGYDIAADTLAVQYESVTFTEVHRDVLHLFPTVVPSRVVDIGTGTGRDAAALARLGHQVVAVEPTAELRAHGQRIHADCTIEWLDDGLPELTALRGRGEMFDLILLTAVWMHLDADERAASMKHLAGLTAPGGRIVLSLRHGPVPAGRRMFEVTAAETIELAAGHGLVNIHHSKREDVLGRGEVRWSYLGFERANA